ncbi:MAG TPA: hypothetical protein VMZ22_04925 [Acidimicrobiales bacterium]|nr:hypothetical protein [Acidimicrobiales bacterium]
MTKLRWSVAVAVFAGAVFGCGVAFAAATTYAAGPVNKVAVVTSDTTSQVTSTSFVEVPRAAVTITVPSGTTALLIARFTAQSMCGGAGSSVCSVRIVDNGTEMEPVSGPAFAFDSQSGTNCICLAESHSVERVLRVSAGKHRIAVQALIGQPNNIRFELSNWLLRADVAA